MNTDLQRSPKADTGSWSSICSRPVWFRVDQRLRPAQRTYRAKAEEATGLRSSRPETRRINLRWIVNVFFLWLRILLTSDDSGRLPCQLLSVNSLLLTERGAPAQALAENPRPLRSREMDKEADSNRDHAFWQGAL